MKPLHGTTIAANIAIEHTGATVGVPASAPVSVAGDREFGI